MASQSFTSTALPPIFSNVALNVSLGLAIAVTFFMTSGRPRSSPLAPRIFSNIFSLLPILLFILTIPFIERLRWWRRQLPLLIPGVEFIVQQKWKRLHQYSSDAAAKFKDSRTAKYCCHSFHSKSFTAGNMSIFNKHLSPFIKLIMNVNLHRTNIAAGSTQRRGKG